jgi:N-methylhydantoinase B/oxoprolinase/acetone carboxylase alpha subunit
MNVNVTSLNELALTVIEAAAAKLAAYNKAIYDQTATSPNVREASINSYQCAVHTYEQACIVLAEAYVETI